MGIEFIARKCDESGAMLWIYGKLLAHGISVETQTVRRIGEIHTAIDFILVDTPLKQRGDSAVYLRGVGRIREIAGIGHHASVQAFGHIGVDKVTAPHPVKHKIYQQRGGGCFRMRNHYIRKRPRKQVVVNHHLQRRRCQHGLLHVVDPFGVVIVQGKYHIGVMQHFRSRTLEARERHYIARSRKKGKIFRGSVGRYHLHALAGVCQSRRQAERRPHGIAVGRKMAGNHHLTHSLQLMPQLPYDLFIKFYFIHNQTCAMI